MNPVAAARARGALKKRYEVAPVDSPSTRAVMEYLGLSLRRPCVAGILLDRAAVHLPTETRARLVAAGLQEDVPDEWKALLRWWNHRQAEPLSGIPLRNIASAVEELSGTPIAWGDKCQNIAHSSYHGLCETCPAKGGSIVRVERPKLDGLADLATSGHLQSLSLGAIRLYAGIELLENELCRRYRNGFTYFYLTHAELAEVSACANVGYAAEQLQEAGLIQYKAGEPFEGGDASEWRRILPVPLSWGCMSRELPSIHDEFPWGLPDYAGVEDGSGLHESVTCQG